MKEFSSLLLHNPIKAFTRRCEARHRHTMNSLPDCQFSWDLFYFRKTRQPKRHISFVAVECIFIIWSSLLRPLAHCSPLCQQAEEDDWQTDSFSREALGLGYHYFLKRLNSLSLVEMFPILLFALKISSNLSKAADAA